VESNDSARNGSQVTENKYLLVDKLMFDLIFIGAILGFFLAAFGYVRGCEKLS
jgi:hypothetical protein